MKLVIPNEIRYGLQNRSDTFTGKLGFMIYANKPNGTYGQQVSFDGWRDQKIAPKDIPNNYQTGFVLNKGHLNKYHFGASVKFRVFHPEGFEFEISLENLSLLIDYSEIHYGDIQLPCCIAWEGSNVYLLPQVSLNNRFEVEHFDVLANKAKAEKRLNKINNSGKAIPARSLTSGKIVEDATGNRFVISSPTKSNYHREEIVPIVVKETTDGFEITSSLGQGYHPSFNENCGKVFYPLSNIDTVISKEQENQFFKFVEKDDLNKQEAKNLEILKSQIVFQFHKNQNFVPLQNDAQSIERFIQKICNNYDSKNLADYNNEKGKVFILDEMVKINDKLFHVIIGHNYRLGYGSYPFEKRLKNLHDKLNNLKYYLYHNKYSRFDLFFAPVTGENNSTYSGLVYKTEREMLHFGVNKVTEQTPMDAKVIFDEINKELIQGLTELLEPITQEDIDNQKRLYLEQ